MADCENNILDIPSSASAPGANEVLIFTLPDGNSVIRPWSVVSASSSLPDYDEEVAPGELFEPGDTNKTFSELVGKRIRFYRTGIKQSTINQGGSYYSFNPATGTVSWVPALSNKEIIQIEVY